MTLNFNPYLTSGHVHPYHLDESMYSYLLDVCMMKTAMSWVFMPTNFFFTKMLNSLILYAGNFEANFGGKNPCIILREVRYKSSGENFHFYYVYFA